MKNKFKNLKILVLAKYYFIGIILAVFVFQFVLMSLTNRTLDFGAFVANDTLRQLISLLFGAFAGGLIFLAMRWRAGNTTFFERQLWQSIDKNSLVWFRIRLMIAVSIGILVNINLDIVFDAEEFNLIGDALISEENIIRSISGVCGASVFGLILSVGVYKRLRLLFADEVK